MTAHNPGASDAACDTDIVWIPSVPLPLLGWRTDECWCGQKFRGKKRRAAYELHYRREHMGDDRVDPGPNSGYVDVAVTRAEARRIYAEVNGDTGEERGR